MLQISNVVIAIWTNKSIFLWNLQVTAINIEDNGRLSITLSDSTNFVDSVLVTDFMKPKFLRCHKVFDLIGTTSIESNFDERTGLITFVLKKFYLFDRTQQFIIGAPEDLNSSVNKLR